MENLIIIVVVLIFICVSCFIVIFYVSYRTTKSLAERAKNVHIQNKIDIAISSSPGVNQMKHVNSSSLEHINDINHLSSASPSNLEIQERETKIHEYNGDISILTDTTCPPLPPSIQSRNNYNQTILAKPATIQQTVIMRNDEALEIEGTGYDETMTTIPNILQNNNSGRFWD